jgi:hypothetical protein
MKNYFAPLQPFYNSSSPANSRKEKCLTRIISLRLKLEKQKKKCLPRVLLKAGLPKEKNLQKPVRVAQTEIRDVEAKFVSLEKLTLFAETIILYFLL